MILVIDNYDSFTFNLVQYLGEMGHELKVFRNDAITLDSIESLAPKSIVISPGPGRPENSGIIIQLIREFAGKIPILGVCLGHQAIGAAFGGDVVPAPSIMHGKTSDIFHDGKTIFSGLPSPFRATRYHSLVVSPETFPDCLEISARTDDGVIMGLRHREIIVEGVQFHPESILTDVGMKLLSNFVNL
ncbi:MAG: aminodeoxychorismate/anthranilate synthase component II [Acidobacteriota bacterium]|jgi:anthranilate synthase/aminodeoxychorismate synthase-like glutamine amidotransferase